MPEPPGVNVTGERVLRALIGFVRLSGRRKIVNPDQCLMANCTTGGLRGKVSLERSAPVYQEDWLGG